MTEIQIFSRDVKPGQKVVLVLLMCILIIILVLAILYSSFNYLLIFFLGLVCFFPIYLYALSFYTVELDQDFFVLSNIFKKKKITKKNFVKVIPTKTALTTFNTGYFTIIFDTGEHYNFSANIKRGLIINKKKVAQQITDEIKRNSET